MEALLVLYAIIFWYIIVLDFCYILLLFCSLKALMFNYIEHKLFKSIRLMQDFRLPSVTVIIPIYNHGDIALNSIYSVMENDKSEQISIILVNDGSVDDSLQILTSTFDMHKVSFECEEKILIRHKVKGYYYSKSYPRIMLIDKENGGKSDALNAGVNMCESDLFVTLDHDTIINNDAIENLVFCFFRKRNAVAIGGAVYVLNGCKYENGKILEKSVSKNALCAAQSCEYLRSFLYGRAGWDTFGGSLCYSGAFTLFDYNAVIDVGGFDYNNIANDFEIITHLQSYSKNRDFKSRLGFASSAIAWTITPSTIKDYWKQRINWQMGSIQSLVMHKHMFFNYRYGVIGLVTFPFFLLGEILGPFIIGTGYIIALICWFYGYVNFYWVIMILMLSIGLSFSISLSTIFISAFTDNHYRGIKQKWLLFRGLLLENLGLRVILVACNYVATIKYILGKRPSLHL